MSFYNTMVLYGFEIGITDGVGSSAHALLDLEDDLIIEAIKNSDLNLFRALIAAKNKYHEIEAINTFNNFTCYFLQGHGWERALNRNSTEDLLKLKRKAETVLWSDYSQDYHKEEARTFLNALDGVYPEYILTEQDIKDRKQYKYNSSRSKWLKLLIEDRGYKCQSCGIEKDLRIKHITTIQKGGETELNNLELRCTKCINK